MKKNLLKIGFLSFFIALSGQLFAQSIKGKVTDTAGVVIPGVSVQIEGTKVGVSTDANGMYSLQLPTAGKYKLKVKHTSFQVFETFISVGKDEEVVQNFKLKDNKETLQAVNIIGSRSSVPRTNIESAVPVDLITSKDVKSFAQMDVTQMLNYVAPSFSSNRQTIADGTDHIDPASLRGLGPDQVLVLVNGKRRHTTALVNINGTFGRGTVGTDLNAIPLTAIERIEVLRDGAAAQYGSDAIAGVINIVLKKVTPYSISTSYGQSYSKTLGRTFTDGANIQFDFNKGWSFGHNKGFLNVAAQYLNRGYTSRSGLDTRPLLYSGIPSRGATETEADFVARFAALKAIDDATANANGLSRDNIRVGNSESKGGSIFINGQYNFNKNTELYLATGGNLKYGHAGAFYRLPFQTTLVDLTLYPNGFLPFIDSSISDLSFALGLRGKLNSWDYDISNTSGQNTIRFDVVNTNNASLPLGTSPTSFYAGTLIFAQNTTNFDINKKHNFDGSFLKSLNTAFGAEYRVDDYQIKAGDELSYSFGQPSANIPGRLIGSTFTAAGAQSFPGYKPSNALNKSRSNIGLYADLEAELGSVVTLGGAGRYENFSDFGSNFSYKFTGKIKLTPDVSLRGAFATGFRAPSLHQQYFSNESTQFVLSTPTQVLTANNDSPVVKQFGIDKLKPEISQSGSIGLAGKIINNFTFTVDAYNIDISDRIVFSSQFIRERNSSTNALIAGPVNTILNTVDPTAQINSVQFFTNAIKTNTAGLDVVLTNKFPINNNSNLTLSMAANFNKTIVRDINGSTTINSNPALKAKLFDRLERSRFETAVPKNKLNITANYKINKVSVLARVVRFGEVTYLNPTEPTVANGLAGIDQTFSPKWVTDLSVSYAPSKNWNITLGANNVFDVYPDANYINPRNNENNLSSSSATNYTSSLDNTSNGRFAYSRAVTQFGFNGRYVYSKVAYTF